MEAPMPKNERPNRNYFQGIVYVGCPTKLRCDAFGTYHNKQDDGLLLTGSGLSWTSVGQYDTFGGEEACTSAKSCYAAGRLGGELMTGWGVTWAFYDLPAPPNAIAGNYDDIESVTCPSTSECVAAGSYQDASGFSQGTLVTGKGSSWTAVEAPLPPNAAADPGVNMSQDLTCLTVSSCTVTGSYTDTSGNEQGLLLTGSGNSWAATQMPLPTNAAANPRVNSWSVACLPASSCAVIGSYTTKSGSGQGLLVTGSGRSWKAVKPPLPSGASSAPDISLSDGTCPSATSCTLLGTYTDSIGDKQGLLLTGSGTSWTPTKAPLPQHGFTVDELSTITCVSATRCLVLGDYFDLNEHDQGLLLTGAGSTWLPTKAPLPANASTAFPSGVQFWSAACQSVSRCLAAGTYTDTSGDGEPLILAYG
jgi:hypothetical protein